MLSLPSFQQLLQPSWPNVLLCILFNSTNCQSPSQVAYTSRMVACLAICQKCILWISCKPLAILGLFQDSCLQTSTPHYKNIFDRKFRLLAILTLHTPPLYSHTIRPSVVFSHHTPLHCILTPHTPPLYSHTTHRSVVFSHHTLYSSWKWSASHVADKWGLINVT